MNLLNRTTTQFDRVITNVKETSRKVDCSGAAVLILHKNKVVAEEYWGKKSKQPNAQSIQESTRFHVASVRKSYIGFAVAYAVHKGFVASIDDPIEKYLSGTFLPVMKDTTIRHLLTHSHGLKKIKGTIFREFQAGESWAYRGINIDLLSQIVRNATGQTIAEIVQQQALSPLELKDTGWYGVINEKHVDVIKKANDPNWMTSTNTDGSQMNMYVSARDLAKWGYVHLNRGFINGEQMIDKEIIDLATSVQSPSFKDTDLPQNGYLWFVKDLQAKKSELGESTPTGSYQILGYTGVTLLVIPKYNLVAVRAFNSFGSPEGFDYLEDVRRFGDVVVDCVKGM